MRGHSGFTTGDPPGNHELARLDLLLAGLGARIDEVDGELARLDRRAAALRRERSALVDERGALNERRTNLAIALTQPVPDRPAAPDTPAPRPVPGPSGPPPAPARVPAARPAPTPAVALASTVERPADADHGPSDEASALSVQAVLLTLGGLLLGVAAITFTAVAWTTFGPAGRAAILGTVTVVALAVPWLLTRRGLAATAETISAVALLLVGLDGYAAHSVGLLGVDRLLPAPTYAGLVLLVTAGVAAGYPRLAPLHAPGFVALLAVQPVLPLLAVGIVTGGSGGPDASGPALPPPGSVVYAGIGILAAAVAAQNVAALRWLRGSPESAVTTGRRALTWLFIAVTGTAAWVAAAVALLPAPSALTAVPAGVAMLAAAAVTVELAALVGRERALAAGAAVVAVVVALGVPVALAVPGAEALPFAAPVPVLVYAVGALRDPWRGGATAGAWAVGAVVGGWTLLQVAGHVTGVLDPGPALAPTVLCLTTAATALPDRAGRHHGVVAGLAATVLALPTGPAVTVAGALAFGASTLFTTRRAEAAVRGWAAAVLAVVAVATALGEPPETAAVLAAVALGGVVLAAVAAGRRNHPVAPAVASPASGTAIAAAPGAAVTLAIAVGADSPAVRAVALLAMAGAVLVAAVLVAAVLAARRLPPPTVAGTSAARRLPAPIVAGAALGCLSVSAAGTVAGPLDAVAGALPGLVAVVALVARRSPVFTAGAVAATIAVLSDLAATTVPGTGLAVAAALVAAALVAGTAEVSRWPADGLGPAHGVRNGAVVAGAAVAAVAVPLAGGAALAAAVTAVRPPWTTDLGAWADLAGGVAVLGWQVPVALALVAVAAAVGLPGDRRLPALLGVTTVVLALPAALALPWWTPIVLSGGAGTAFALVAARLRRHRDVLVTAGLAAVLGLHAAAVSVARPHTTAAVLAATVAVCVLVAVVTPVDRLRDAAVGGALAALPGAAAATAAALSVRPALVLSLGLATASLALGAASLIGLARRAQLPAAGAVAGALVCVAVAAVVPSATGWDHLAAALLLVGALSRVWPRRRESRGAGGATLAFAAEMSQLLALLVPGAPVLTTAAVVAGTAFVVRRLPVGWRSGPLGGLAVAGGTVAVAAGLAAVVDSVHTVAALSPWGADLGRWPRPVPPGVEVLGWQPAAALLVLAVAAVAVRGSGGGDAQTTGFRVARAAPAFALVVVALAAVHGPVGWGLPWWTPAAVATLAAAGYGMLAVRTGSAPVAAVLAAGLAAYAGAASLARPSSTALTLTALVVAGTLVAAYAARAAHRVTGAGAVFLALALVPAAAAAWMRTLDLPVAVPHVTVAAMALVLAGAVAARRPYGPWARAGVAVAGAGVLAMPPGGPTPPHVAVVALVGMATAVLVPWRALPPVADRVAAKPHGPGVVPWVAPALVVVGYAVPLLDAALVGPFQSADDGLPELAAPDPALPALALLTVGLAGLLWFGGRRPWLVPALLTPVAATVLVTPVAVPLPWPAPVVAALAVAVTSGIAAALMPSTRVTTPLCCAVAVVAGAAALAGAAATRPTTYAALGVVAAAGVVAGALGRHAAARTAGWLVAAVGALVLACLVDLAAGPFLVAPALLGTAALLDRQRRHPAELVALEAVSGVAAVTALATADLLRGTATVLIGYGAVLGLSALRGGRRWFAPVAGVAELLAWWMLLFAADVGAIEAYTLPFALVALAGGILWRGPATRSWVAFGPALAAAFLPSLALVLVSPGEPLRRLLLGAAAIAVVVLGGARRWQAPVVVGAVVVVLVTLHELVVWWDTLPRWLPLAAGGLLLVTVGATYERRRRDLRRVHTAVSRMR